MNGEGIIDRACARTFHRWPARYAVISLCGSLTAAQFFPRDLTSSIFIQSVNFIDRKNSLHSELSEFEGINVNVFLTFKVSPQAQIAPWKLQGVTERINKVRELKKTRKKQE